MLWTDFLPYRSTRWFAVVDARGRVAWTHKGDEQTSLLVIASRSTPLPYLAHLRQERIPYLLAGAHRVDLTSALAKIGTQLGAECLVSEAGGGLNGALLQAGLVDELHSITVPALIGGLGTPSIMDGPPPALMTVALLAVAARVMPPRVRPTLTRAAQPSRAPAGRTMVLPAGARACRPHHRCPHQATAGPAGE